MEANDTLILAACGYVHEHIPEYWEDVGDPENGPKLDGNPEMDIWYRLDHEIVVIDDVVTHEGPTYPGPEGWEAEF